MMKIFKLTIAVIVFSFVSGEAAFERVGMNARVTGMGGALAARPGGATAVFHNPSALAFYEESKMDSSFSRLLWGVEGGPQLGMLSLSYPFDSFGVGLGWQSLRADGIYYEDVVVLGGGKEVMEGLSAGVSLSFYRLGYGEDEYTAINPVFADGRIKQTAGVGLGAMLKRYPYSAGLWVDNINRPDMGLRHTDRHPVKVRAGGGYERKSMYYAADLYVEERDVKFSAGASRSMGDFVLRGGGAIGTGSLYALSMGMGYSVGMFTVDYGFEYPLSGIGGMYGTHSIDVKARLGLFGGDEPEVVEKPMPVSDKVSADDRRKSRMLYARSREKWREGYYEKARELLEESLEVNPDNSEALDAERKISRVSDRIKDASGDEKRDVILRQGIDAYIRGEGEMAVAAMMYAGELWPGDDSIAEVAAEVENEFPEESSRDVPELGVIEQRLQRALEAIYSGSYMSAVENCWLVLRLEPEETLALKRLGSAYFAMGRNEDARNIWNIALELEPGDEELVEFLEMEEEEDAPDERWEIEDDDFRQSMRYYRRLKASGTDRDVLKRIIRRLIERYEDALDVEPLLYEKERLGE